MDASMAKALKTELEFNGQVRFGMFIYFCLRCMTSLICTKALGHSGILLQNSLAVEPS
jgi:hypothetical protein